MNAGETYQWLVDNGFRDQIDRNIEVYVDAMVIKSHNDSALLKDIEEPLKTIEKVRMKLKPTKCMFGVKVEKFLGYYVTKEGIHPSSEKVVELLDTTEPRNLKEMQALNRKITTLGCFIARSAYKVILLFRTFNGFINKHNFQCKPEADRALQDLKKSFRKIPTLASPTPWETLSIYLSATEESISAVLMVERQEKQWLIYVIIGRYKEQFKLPHGWEASVNISICTQAVVLLFPSSSSGSFDNPASKKHSINAREV